MGTLETTLESRANALNVSAKETRKTYRPITLSVF